MSISASQSATDKFRVTGDKETEFPVGRAVTLVQGVDGNTVVYVSASSYSAGGDYTEVTCDILGVTANLATVMLGAVSPASLAQHDHSTRLEGGYIPASAFSYQQVVALQTIDIPTTGDQYKMLRVDSAETDYELITLQGTTNQVTLTDAAGTLTFSLPQNIHTSATPTFWDIVLTGLSGVLVSSGASGVAGVGELKHLGDVNDVVTDSAASGDIMYYLTADYRRLAIGSEGDILHVSSGYPVWSELDGDKIDIDWTPSYYTPDATPAEADDVDDLTAHLYGIDQALNGKAVVDGDILDITWNPTNYTPAVTPSEVTSVDELTAHLYGIDQELGTLSTAPPAHGSTHIDGGSDALDGDKVEITWTPTYYTPATTPSEVDATDQLTAHLHGIDEAINVASGGNHASSHIDGGGDPLDGDKLEITYTPTNYTPTTSPSEVDATDQLTAHLAAIDTELAAAGGGASSDWYPPAMRWKDADEVYVVPGKYFRGGHLHRGNYQDESGLATSWSVSSLLSVDVDATYSSGVSPGMIGGGKEDNFMYGVYLLGNTANDVIVLPFFAVHEVDYNVTYAGKTTITMRGPVLKEDYGIYYEDTTDYSDYSYRVVISTSSVLAAGGRVRVALSGNSDYDLYIDNVAIVERSGSTSGGTTTPTEILFGGTSGVTISSGVDNCVWSDWLDYDYDPTNEYLLICDIGSTASRLLRNASGGTSYYEASSNTYTQQNMNGGESSTSRIYMVHQFEVQAYAEELLKANDAWNNYQLVKHSSDASLDGDVVTIEDTIENVSASDEVVINGDEVSTGAQFAEDDWLQLIPPSTTDFVYLGSIKFDASGDLVQFRKHGRTTEYAEPVTIEGSKQYSIDETEVSCAVPPVAEQVKVVTKCSFQNVLVASVFVGFYYSTGASSPYVQLREVYGDSGDQDYESINSVEVTFWEPCKLYNKFTGKHANEATELPALYGELQITGWFE